VGNIAGALKRWREEAARGIGAPAFAEGWVDPDRLLTIFPAVATLPRADETDVERAPAPRPAASADALRLAVRLLAENQPRHMWLFGATATGRSARRLVYETATALVELNERPVLVIDVDEGDSDDANMDAFAAWPRCSLDEVVAAVTAGIPPSSASRCGSVVRVATSDRNVLAFLASEDFGRFVTAARERFKAIVCQAKPSGVAGLALARHCDGVVLAVAEGSTISQVRATSEQLRGAHARVIGFVLERAAGSGRPLNGGHQ